MYLKHQRRSSGGDMDSLVLFRNEKTVSSCKSEVLWLHRDCGRSLLGTNSHRGVIQWANIRSYTTLRSTVKHTPSARSMHHSGALARLTAPVQTPLPGIGRRYRFTVLDTGDVLETHQHCTWYCCVTVHGLVMTHPHCPACHPCTKRSDNSQVAKLAEVNKRTHNIHTHV